MSCPYSIVRAEAGQVGNAWEEYIDNTQQRVESLEIYNTILQNRDVTTVQFYFLFYAYLSLSRLLYFESCDFT